jgi:SpoVK/Ycf46/Vps4 family AAA+-type ATPase
VLLIDEIEKSLSVNATSGGGDSGTSSRMFATLLSWLSDREGAQFVVATSNNHLALPPELVRSGRFNVSFFVGLPSEEERKDILQVVIKKYGRKPKDFDLKKLIQTTDNYVGAEIEELFKNAMYFSFSEKKEVDTDAIVAEAKKFIPHAKMFPQKIKEQYEAAEGKLVMAGKSGKKDDPFKHPLFRDLDLSLKPGEAN